MFHCCLLSRCLMCHVLWLVCLFTCCPVGWSDCWWVCLPAYLSVCLSVCWLSACIMACYLLCVSLGVVCLYLAICCLSCLSVMLLIWQGQDCMCLSALLVCSSLPPLLAAAVTGTTFASHNIGFSRCSSQSFPCGSLQDRKRSP